MAEILDGQIIIHSLLRESSRGRKEVGRLVGMALTKGFFRGSITRPQHLEEEEIELTRPCYKREISDSVKPSKNVSYTR